MEKKNHDRSILYCYETKLIFLEVCVGRRGQHFISEIYNYVIYQYRLSQGFQSADSIYEINLLTSALFKVNTMWTN